MHIASTKVTQQTSSKIVCFTLLSLGMAAYWSIIGPRLVPSMLFEPYQNAADNWAVAGSLLGILLSVAILFASRNHKLERLFVFAPCALAIAIATLSVFALLIELPPDAQNIIEPIYTAIMAVYLVGMTNAWLLAFRWIGRRPAILATLLSMLIYPLILIVSEYAGWSLRMLRLLFPCSSAFFWIMYYLLQETPSEHFEQTSCSANQKASSEQHNKSAGALLKNPLIRVIFILGIYLICTSVVRSIFTLSFEADGIAEKSLSSHISLAILAFIVLATTIAHMKKATDTPLRGWLSSLFASLFLT